MIEFIVDQNFQTPPNVCKYMVELIPPSAKTVLEPTPGLLNIVKALEEKRRYNITAPKDFFQMDSQAKFDCVVMNPPFSSKTAYMEFAPKGAETRGMKLGYYILKECMEKSDNIIALMPWFTLSDSDVRLRYLKSFGLKSLTALPRKTFQYARIQTVIIELQKGYQYSTIFKTFDY
jgi:type I restriction-modification system DNA methylase subunit